MYDYSVRYNPIDTWRGVIDRDAELLQRISPTILLPGESCLLDRDADGLGGRFTVVSGRPEVLLKKIKQEAFPTIGFSPVQTTDGEHFWSDLRVVLPLF
jgi:hypothetical protein